MTDRMTIYALSSGHGRAGVAVIRVSGDRAGEIVDRMAAPRPKPRFAAFRRVKHPLTQEVLDEALVLWFPGPRSETGEDMAELQVHGGSAILRSVFSALQTFPDCRMAEPGEFVRRAFESGRLDLTAVEGLGDLIEAETEAQRRLALSQAGGALAKIYDGWRARLIEARALIEAAIDFSDEADVARDAQARGRDAAATLAAEIAAHLDDAHRGEIIRDGFRVVLAGPPNAGKSSLLNALARREVAIVSPEAGTTRDAIEVRLDLDGFAVSVTDTAGIREPSGAVEAEGIRRTLTHARAADLIVWLVDAMNPVWVPPADIGASADRLLVVVNKVDAPHDRAAGTLPGAIPISALTGQGLPDLIRAIARRVGAQLEGGGEAPLITQQRHRLGIETAYAALARCLNHPAKPAELQAEDLREAANALARVVGRVDVEDVLDLIFGRFCIGK